MPHNTPAKRRAYAKKFYHSSDTHRAELIFSRKLTRWRIKFKVTDEKLLELLDEQHDLCAVCHQPFADAFDSLRNGSVGLVPSIDHDHSCCPGEQTCGKCIRGIVHLRCNRLCGMAKDNPEILRRCADYLEKKR
jgi:hypothetical protein